MKKVCSRELTASAIIGALLVMFLAPGVGPALAAEEQHKAKREDDFEIKKGALSDEEKLRPAHGGYSKAEPGKSRRLKRAFKNSPALIPHDLTGMLPITKTDNACLVCHMPEAATLTGATAIPRSHFFDIDTARDLSGKLHGKRYICVQCHVPQVDMPRQVKSQFRGDFRSGKSRTNPDVLNYLNNEVKTE